MHKSNSIRLGESNTGECKEGCPKARHQRAATRRTAIVHRMIVNCATYPTIAKFLWPVALVHLVLCVISCICAGSCSTCHTVLKEGSAKLMRVFYTFSPPGPRERLQHAILADKEGMSQLAGLPSKQESRESARDPGQVCAGSLQQASQSTIVPRGKLCLPQHNPEIKREEWSELD